jgi:MFS family permease
MRTVAVTALGGTSIEWYDFFIYGTAAALIFPTLFFAEDMPRYVALLASFSTFAVGFIARPIGGVLFGHFGDRVGRKAALVTALMMMGVATTLIGLLPGYAQIGPLAPLLLILLRFVQGLAVGGQWGGAMLLVTENAPANQRGFLRRLCPSRCPGRTGAGKLGVFGRKRQSYRRSIFGLGVADTIHLQRFANRPKPLCAAQA